MVKIKSLRHLLSFLGLILCLVTLIGCIDKEYEHLGCKWIIPGNFEMSDQSKKNYMIFTTDPTDFNQDYAQIILIKNVDKNKPVNFLKENMTLKKESEFSNLNLKEYDFDIKGEENMVQKTINYAVLDEDNKHDEYIVFIGFSYEGMIQSCKDQLSN